MGIPLQDETPLGREARETPGRRPGHEARGGQPVTDWSRRVLMVEGNRTSRARPGGRIRGERDAAGRPAPHALARTDRPNPPEATMRCARGRERRGPTRTHPEPGRDPRQRRRVLQGRPCGRRGRCGHTAPSATVLTRGGAVAARWAHNPKVGGSNPSPATHTFTAPMHSAWALFVLCRGSCVDFGRQCKCCCWLCVAITTWSIGRQGRCSANGFDWVVAGHPGGLWR